MERVIMSNQEDQLIQIVQTLPAELMAKVVEFAEPLQQQLKKSRDHALLNETADSVREDEAEWDRQFAGSADVLQQLANKALADHRVGKTSLLDSDRYRYIPFIVEELKSIRPYKIILFGSYAYGKPTIDSDIDLLVVTDSDYFPNNYKEKSDIHLEVAKRLRRIRKYVPIDLIVQTKSMHRKFVELNSMFSQEILQRGKILYEGNHASMA